MRIEEGDLVVKGRDVFGLVRGARVTGYFQGRFEVKSTNSPKIKVSSSPSMLLNVAPQRLVVEICRPEVFLHQKGFGVHWEATSSTGLSSSIVG